MRMIRKKPVQHERQEIVMFVRWLKLAHPHVFFYKVHNEGRRGPHLVKEQGIVSGVPDICICEPIGRYHGLYIEMKRADGKGVIGVKQKEVIVTLRARGYAVEVCAGVQKAMSVTRAYLKGIYRYGFLYDNEHGNLIY